MQDSNNLKKIQVKLFFNIIPYFCIMEIIRKYFKELTPLQDEQLSRLQAIYEHLNSMVNLISRQDIEHLYERHVLHSLSIARIADFASGTHIMDAGTGGGFPGIPLAIIFPEVHFTLVDSIGKKINCVKTVIDELGLENVIAVHGRMEELDNTYDFVVSRAVTALPVFLKWARPKVSRQAFNKIPNGIIYLKGGDFEDELRELKTAYSLYNLSDYFGEEFFHTKKAVYLPV